MIPLINFDRSLDFEVLKNEISTRPLRPYQITSQLENPTLASVPIYISNDYPLKLITKVEKN